MHVHGPIFFNVYVPTSKYKSTDSNQTSLYEAKIQYVVLNIRAGISELLSSSGHECRTPFGPAFWTEVFSQLCALTARSGQPDRPVHSGFGMLE
jgi:hypothetical protein